MNVKIQTGCQGSNEGKVFCFLFFKYCNLDNLENRHNGRTIK